MSEWISNVMAAAPALSVEVSERLFQLLRNDPASPLRSAPTTE